MYDSFKSLTRLSSTLTRHIIKILEYIDIEDILNDEQNKEQFLKMLKCKTIKDVYERRCIKN